MTDGVFSNCYNTGKLVLLAQNSATEMAGTSGIVGIYRALGGSEAFANTLSFYNCFDFSQREYQIGRAHV